ncbi:unnamed protein product [Amoebophrya sp. A25]|nr:unnamed protein product [Amoebophrya sp. A25]|eukprot:GSA25T00021266001.1
MTGSGGFCAGGQLRADEQDAVRAGPPCLPPPTRAPMVIGNAAWLAQDGSGALCVEIGNMLSGEAFVAELAKEFVAAHSNAGGSRTAVFSLIDLKRAVFAKVVGGERLHFGELDVSMRRHVLAESPKRYRDAPVPAPKTMDVASGPASSGSDHEEGKNAGSAGDGSDGSDSGSFRCLRLIVKDPPFFRGAGRCVTLFSSREGEATDDDAVEIADSFRPSSAARDSEEPQLAIVALRMMLEAPRPASGSDEIISDTPKSSEQSTLLFALRSRSLRQLLMNETRAARWGEGKTPEEDDKRGETLGTYLLFLGMGSCLRVRGENADRMYGCREPVNPEGTEASVIDLGYARDIASVLSVNDVDTIFSEFDDVSATFGHAFGGPDYVASHTEPRLKWLWDDVTWVALLQAYSRGIRPKRKLAPGYQEAASRVPQSVWRCGGGRVWPVLEGVLDWAPEYFRHMVFADNSLVEEVPVEIVNDPQFLLEALPNIGESGRWTDDCSAMARAVVCHKGFNAAEFLTPQGANDGPRRLTETVLEGLIEIGASWQGSYQDMSFVPAILKEILQGKFGMVPPQVLNASRVVENMPKQVDKSNPARDMIFIYGSGALSSGGGLLEDNTLDGNSPEETVSSAPVRSPLQAALQNGVEAWVCLCLLDCPGLVLFDEFAASQGLSAADSDKMRLEKKYNLLPGAREREAVPDGVNTIPAPIYLQMALLKQVESGLGNKNGTGKSQSSTSATSLDPGQTEAICMRVLDRIEQQERAMEELRMELPGAIKLAKQQGHAAVADRLAKL